MSRWDYIMPHRLLINKSLRKAAEGLRNRIDAYQIEYDRRVEECQEELKKVEIERQERFLQFRNSLEEELQREKSFLESVAQDITSYVDMYFHRNCLFKMRGIKRQQIKILQEDNDFLNSQMAFLGKEIAILRERQNELTSFTDVKDIIRLVSLSSYEISFDENDNAKDLLDKVSRAISNCGRDQDTEKFALVYLKGIIQERSEYIPTIKYITWVIQQKILFSKQLSNKRKCIRDMQKDIWQEIEQIEDDIEVTNETLEEKARRIRYYWARPITYLNVDISYAYKEKIDIGNILRDIGEELHSMARQHSSDQDKWGRLERERIEFLLEKSSLKISILSKKKERSQWFEKQKYIFQICKKYEAPLVSEMKKQKDEESIISERIAELVLIRDKGVEEAKTEYNKERLNIMTKYYKEHTIMEFKLCSLEKEKKKLEEACKKMSLDSLSNEIKMRKIEADDNRFLLKKLFSKTPEYKEMQNKLISIKDKLATTKKAKLEIENQKMEMKEKLDELDRRCRNELKKCTIVFSDMTKEACYELEKLFYRKSEIGKKHRENSCED